LTCYDKSIKSNRRGSNAGDDDYKSTGKWGGVIYLDSCIGAAIMCVQCA